MRHVYEFMTQSERLPKGPDAAKDAALLNQNTANMFTGAIDAMEKKLSGEIAVLSHSQIVVGDRVVTTLLVRRPGVVADPRRN
jgi:hypothetical protein